VHIIINTMPHSSGGVHFEIVNTVFQVSFKILYVIFAIHWSQAFSRLVSGWYSLVNLFLIGR
jgi:hypothetical protein